MLVWRIYLWAFSAVQILSALGRALLRYKKPEAVSRYDVFEGFFSLVSIPAFLGFAYQRAYGPMWFWWTFTFVLLAMNVYQFFAPKMKVLYAKGWKPTTGALALQFAIGAPALWALVVYSYFEPYLWR